MKKKIRVGSRESKLAVIQSQMVIDAIKAYDPEIEVELITMKTTGDIILDKTLDKIGGKGLFVKELDRALMEEKVDITVHSYKDMPMEENPLLPVVGVSSRESEWDALVLPEGKAEILADKPIGSSSSRRVIQLKILFENPTKAVRGNVISRLEKLDNGEYSALVLASAGLKRLGLENRISRIFTKDEIMPAACQGVLAIQARKGFDVSFLEAICDKDTRQICEGERGFVRALGGGCSSPVAANASISGDKIEIDGMYVDEKNQIYKGKIVGEKSEARKLGEQLAKELKENANK